jgi:hypothetical protein
MEKAKREAYRFLEAVTKMEGKVDADKHAWYGCSESGQLKRSSMDLSRALIDLRKKE